jgi:hypothetical protein
MSKKVKGKNVKKNVETTNGAGAESPAEVYKSPYPFPFSETLRTRTFVVLGRDPMNSGKLFIKYYRKNISASEAEKFFPVAHKEPGQPFKFGQMVAVVRTAAQIQEMEGCSKEEALEMVRVTYGFDSDGNFYAEPSDPINFYRIGLDWLWPIQQECGLNGPSAVESAEAA